MKRRKKLAVVTTLWNYRSHAWHMAERFLYGYPLLLSMTGGRLGAWRMPLTAIGTEFVNRWAKPFGLVGPFGLRQARVIVLVAICCGLIWAVLRFKELTRQGFGLVVAVGLLDLVLLCFGDATKNAAYLIHVLPWLYVSLAILLVRY